VVDGRTGAKIDVDALITDRSANRAANSWLPMRCSDFAPPGSDIGPCARYAEEKSGPINRIVTQGGGSLVLMYRRLEIQLVTPPILSVVDAEAATLCR
jgi:hypothetical protein